MCIYTRLHIHNILRTYIHIYIYTYIHIYIYTYIRIYIYVHKILHIYNTFKKIYTACTPRECHHHQQMETHGLVDAPDLNSRASRTPHTLSPDIVPSPLPLHPRYPYPYNQREHSRLRMKKKARIKWLCRLLATWSSDTLCLQCVAVCCSELQ